VASKLTIDEHKRIGAAIKAAEQRTAADFSLVITPASDRYPLHPMVWAGFCSLTLAAVVAFIWPRIGGRSVILIQMAAMVVLNLIFDFPPIRLWLVPDRIKRARAEHLAHREFAAHVQAGGISKHRVLLFVSTGERYVEIIADHETHAMVPGGTWDKIVADFVGKVKAGRVADGVLSAIEACGAVLETHHPAAKS